MKTSSKKIRIVVDEDLKEIVPSYFASRINDVGMLVGLIESKDFETIRKISHDLIGTGSSYGFDTISDIGLAINRAAKQKNVKTISESVEKLSQYLNHVEIEYQNVE